jgi:hypothetical protein
MDLSDRKAAQLHGLLDHRPHHPAVVDYQDVDCHGPPADALLFRM